MTLGTPLAVLLTIAFLIPGLIWQRTAKIVYGYAQPRKPELIDYLALSCFNYLFSLPIAYLLIKFCPEGFFADIQSLRIHWLYIIFWLSLVFLLPIICGYVTAKAPIRQLMQKIGISLVHPAPTAWDYVFSRNETFWLRIELNDGRLVEGLFSDNSLASGEFGERDIFLETVFEYNAETKEYEQIERNAGIFIRAQEIKTITFFVVDEQSG